MEPSIEMQILQRLTAVETKLDMQINAKDMAAESLEKAKSAHLRLNDHKIRIDDLGKHVDVEIKAMHLKIAHEVREIDDTREADIKELKLDKRWHIGTLITVACLFVAVAGLALKVLGN